MIQALMHKDYRLLRTYLRISVLSTLAAYLVTFGFDWWLTETYLGESTNISRVQMTLASGSVFGLTITVLLAALLAGSTFTLERIDRSAEFLACLPPTRWQNLISKLAILIPSILGMVAVHLAAGWIAWKLSPYARSIASGRIDLATYQIQTSITLCVTGFSLASSSLMKSNGAPALIGLLSPILCISIVVALGKLLDIPSEGDALVIRYCVVCVFLGSATFLCGCFWYLNRSEP